MPRRREEPRVPWPVELAIDAVTTALLFALFHFVLDMPWELALLIALPLSVMGWWCFLHLQRDDSSGTWTTDSWGGSGGSGSGGVGSWFD